MKKITLYVMTHKLIDDKRVPNDRTKLLVGSYNKSINEYLRDDTLDNISNKNKNYCELTGLYWMWKNDDSEYVGLEHYRRLFSDKKPNPFKYSIVSSSKLLKYLENYDIILPQKHCWPNYDNLYEQYKAEHIESDLKSLENVIKEDYPDYVDAWNQYMYHNKWSYNYNMFVCKKSLIDDYCSFLFGVLFKLEPRVNLDDGRDDYQKRVFGFMSERLFNVWIIKNNSLNIKELNVATLGDRPAKNFVRELYRKIKWRKN